VSGERRPVNPAWAVLAGVSAVTAASALATLLLSSPASFEAETHVPWSTFTQAYPTVADQFELVARSAQLFALSIGLMALAISVRPFRAGERWAWVVMWLLPLSMLPGALGTALTRGDQRVFGLGYLLLAAVAVVAIVAARHQFFALPAMRDGRPADSDQESD
jgi:hypothetical protein